MKKNASRILLSTFILTLFSWQQGKAQVPSQSTDIMLQGFYWNSFTDSSWKNLKTQTTEISQNFDLVWLPPSGNTVTTSSMGYLPIYYFDQTSSFGTQADLKSLIALFKINGTRCLADIVINHRNGRYSWTDFPSETYNGVAYSWGSEAICKGDECVAQGYPATGAADTGENYAAARDIDHSNLNVQNTIKAYMSFLKNDIGYDGWRYDYVKGYRGVYNAMYNDAAGAYMSVGECWDGSYDVVYNWIKSANYKSTAFDFPLKYAINRAFSSNNMTNLISNNGSSIQPAGLINKDQSKKYSVTFVENHDTGASGSTSAFTGDILAANAFILSSPGIPCVYLKHWQTYKDQIKLMIAARKAAGIHSESAITVNQTTTNLYVATVTGKNGNLIVKIGSGSYTAPAGYILAASGTNYAMWTNVAVVMAPTISVSPVGGTYKGGTTVTITATNNASIYFTLDGTIPTISSSKYTSPLSITQNNTVLNAIAIDAKGLTSTIASNTYITSLQPINIHFKAPATWTTVAAYVWENTSTALAGVWPGTVITKDANGMYSYRITNQSENIINVVFNNNNNKEQTIDLSTSNDICWQYGTSTTGGGNTIYAANAITCPSTAIINVAEEDILNLYPNPTSNTVHFITPENANRIVIYSAFGEQMQHTTVFKRNIELDFSSYPTGIYYVIVWKNDGTKQTTAVVKL